MRISRRREVLIGIFGWGKEIFINPVELIIDLDQLYPGNYRIFVVQNFQIEDCNPVLDQCLAGLFLARLVPSNKCVSPESMPHECRSLGIAGTINTEMGEIHGPSDQ